MQVKFGVRWMVASTTTGVRPHPHLAISSTSPDFVARCRMYDIHVKWLRRISVPPNQVDNLLLRVANVEDLDAVTLPLAYKQVGAIRTPLQIRNTITRFFPSELTDGGERLLLLSRMKEYKRRRRVFA